MVGREELAALRLEHAGGDLLVGRALHVHVGFQQVVAAQLTHGESQHPVVQLDLVALGEDAAVIGVVLDLFKQLLDAFGNGGLALGGVALGAFAPRSGACPECARRGSCRRSG